MLIIQHLLKAMEKKTSSDIDHLGLLVLTARFKEEPHGFRTLNGEGRRVFATPSMALGNAWQGTQIKVSKIFKAGVWQVQHSDTSTKHTDARPSPT